MDRFKKAYIKTKEIWSEFPSAGALLVFFVIFFLYASIYFWSPGVIYIDDHFFHFKYAYLLRTQGWDAVKNFDWIFLTRTAQEHSGYSVSLFQLALIPFTYIKDQILGLKIADVFWGSFSVSLIYYVFRKAKILYPELFLLVLVSVSAFASRMLAGRAFVLASALSILLIYFANEKKYKKFFFISIIYIAWHYSTFFIPLVIACIVEAARVLSQQKIHLKSLISSALGTLVGLFMFSSNISRGIYGILIAQLSVTKSGLKGEGNELYKLDMFQILGRSEIILLMLLVSFSVAIYIYIQSKKNDKTEEIRKRGTVFVFSAFLFTLMSFAGAILASGRFMDFYFPAVVFLFGLILTKLIKEKDVSIGKGFERSIIIGLFFFFIFAITNTFINMKSAASNDNYKLVGKAAEWIKDRSKDKELIYLYNWGDFSVSFFYNSKNVYSMGIEPQALYDYSGELYWKWYNINNNGIYCNEPRDCEDVKEKYVADFENADKDTKDRINKENARRIIESIRNDFGARFVITNGKTSEIFKTNEDMVEDSFEAKSETGSGAAYAFELK